MSLEFSYGSFVSGNKIYSNVGVYICRVDGEGFTFKGCHVDVIVKEIRVWSGVCQFIFSAYIFQWDSVSTCYGVQAIQERRAPIRPLHFTCKFSWLHSIRKSGFFLDELGVRLLTTD
jgi:hypothetical protein